MKALIYAALVAGVFVAPTASFAQDANTPLTRAEVRADLIRLEHVGYKPAANDVHYPTDIQAAEARLEAQNTATSASTGEGGTLYGSSQAGAPSTPEGTRSIYFGH
jgi:hypothetical protein